MHYYLRKAVKLDVEHDFLILPYSQIIMVISYNNIICLQGSKSFLSQNWTWISDLICKFEYHWYPFDTQSCHQELEFQDLRGKEIKMTPIKIIYTGSFDLGNSYFTGCPISLGPLSFCHFLGFWSTYRGTFHSHRIAHKILIPKLTLLSILREILTKLQHKT